MEGGQIQEIINTNHANTLNYNEMLILELSASGVRGQQVSTALDQQVRWGKEEGEKHKSYTII